VIAQGISDHAAQGFETTRGAAAWVASALAVGVAVYHATVPVLDSDLWYHLAYARQMRDTGSLISDHTAFSHTPASNAILYCAWLAQLSFLGLYEWAGLPALFALRYAVLAGIVVSWLALARRTGVFLHPLAWGLVVVGVWTMGDAAALKPQLWSVLLLSLTTHTYIWWREAPVARARWLALWPLLMLAWVNTHGGFVMGVLYHAAIVTGEWLTVWMGSRARLPAPALRALMLAVAVSALAVCCTPYGWHYPVQFLTVSLPSAHLAAVRDYDSIFALTQRPLRYVERGAFLLLLCGWGYGRHRNDSPPNWASVIPVVVFFGAYASMARLTPFLAPVVVPIALRMCIGPAQREAVRPSGWAVSVGTVLALVMLSAYEVHATAASLPVGAWRGLGNSYVNPEDEADYLAQHYPGIDIGNDYNTGGYLLFSRWPRGKVFIDARYFPYRDWFTDYLQFESGAATGSVVERFPVDVWVVHLGLAPVLQWFRTSPEWQPEFVGRSAVVFVRRGRSRTDGTLRFSEQTEGMRNPQQVWWLAIFALDVGRRDVAQRVIDSYGGSNDPGQLQQMRILLAALQALSTGDRVSAIAGLQRVAPTLGSAATATLAVAASLEADFHWQGGRWLEALHVQRLALASLPDSVFLQHNVAVMAWWIETSGGQVPDYPWRQELQRLAERPPEDAADFSFGRTQCAEILRGTRQLPPRLYVLPLPH
jgi:hypothetical protein